MPSASITTSADSVEFLAGETLDYLTPGNYLIEFVPGGRMLDIRPVSMPGESGSGTQNFGKRDCIHKLKAVYVGLSEMDCINAFDADCEALAAGAFSMTVDGDGGSSKQYLGCVLNAGPEASQVRSTGRDAGSGFTYRMEATFQVKCLRNS